MHVYWTRNSIPELTSLPKPEQRRVWRSCYGTLFRKWQMWLAIVASFCCIIVGCAIGDWLIPNQPTIIHVQGVTHFVSLSRIPFYVGAGIGGMIGGIIIWQVTSHQIRPHLREYIQTTNAPSNKKP